MDRHIDGNRRVCHLSNGMGAMVAVSRTLAVLALDLEDSGYFVQRKLEVWLL